MQDLYPLARWAAALPPLSPPCMAPSLPRDMALLPTRCTVNERRLENLRAEGRPPNGPSQQLPPALVAPGRKRGEDPSICTSGEGIVPTPHPDVWQVLETLAGVAAVSSSGLLEFGPPPKKARTKRCLPPSAQYARVGHCLPFLLLINYRT
jgi:hypothetical protein